MTGIRQVALALLPLFAVPVQSASAQTATEWSAEALGVKSHAESTIRSARQPELTRTCQIDQAADVVRSSSAPGRVESLRFRASGVAFAALFDGQEAHLSVTSLPWFVREVSVP